MASVTSWTRLEPRTRDERLTAVQARVADPLWLMGRQWQIGELQGEDAGSPILAELDLTVSRISRWTPSAPVATADPLPPDMPLDVLVEAERASVPGGGGDLRAALDACRRLLDLLGTRASDHAGALAAAYGPLPPDPTEPADPEAARLRALATGRFPTPGGCGRPCGPGGPAQHPRQPDSTPPTSRSSTPSTPGCDGTPAGSPRRSRRPPGGPSALNTSSAWQPPPPCLGPHRPPQRQCSWPPTTAAATSTGMPWTCGPARRWARSPTLRRS